MLRRTGRKKGPKRGVATLGDLVTKIYPTNEPEDVCLVRAIAWWERSVPARIARSARPARLRRGLLVIHAVTGAWAQELTFLLPRFMPALERAVPGIDAKNVRVQVGPLPPRPTRRPEPVAHPPLALSEIPHDVARMLAAIADDRVRDAVASAAAQSLAPRRTPRRGGPHGR
jgi:hypothetical protein